MFIALKCCVDRNGAQAPRRPCSDLFVSVVYWLTNLSRAIIKFCENFISQQIQLNYDFLLPQSKFDDVYFDDVFFDDLI